MRAQYGVTEEEVLRWVDSLMFWEASFGFRPPKSYVVGAGNKKKGKGQGVLPRAWDSDQYNEVCPLFAYTTFHLFSPLYLRFLPHVSPDLCF